MTRAPTRLSRRSSLDLALIRRATSQIEELSAVVDRQMLAEPRADERVRLLRQATSQITRAANDAVQAYRRVSRGLQAELERDDTDRDEAARMAAALAQARGEMLHALDVASRRYPWAKPWRPEGEGVDGDPLE